MTNKRQVGDAAEKAAEKFLEQHGYKLVCRNFLCRYGEIDLIMLSPDEEIVFIEVRYRKNQQFGGALESVTPSKQQKIKKTALHYLQQNKQYDQDCRFDVIAMAAHTKQPVIEWLDNAF